MLENLRNRHFCLEGNVFKSQFSTKQISIFSPNSCDTKSLSGESSGGWSRVSSLHNQVSIFFPHFLAGIITNIINHFFNIKRK